MRAIALLLATTLVAGCALTNTTFNKRGAPPPKASEPAQAQTAAAVPADTSRPPATRAVKTAAVTPLVAETTPAPVEGYAVARLVGVDAADQVRVDMAGWPEVVGKDLTVYLAGVTLPQRDGQCQQEVNLARAAKELIREQWTAAKEVRLFNAKRADRFALSAEVLLDGRDLGQQLVQQGLAVEAGQTKPWCP